MGPKSFLLMAAGIIAAATLLSKSASATDVCQGVTDESAGNWFLIKLPGRGLFSLKEHDFKITFGASGGHFLRIDSSVGMNGSIVVDDLYTTTINNFYGSTSDCREKPSDCLDRLKTASQWLDDAVSRLGNDPSKNGYRALACARERLDRTTLLMQTRALAQLNQPAIPARIRRDYSLPYYEPGFGEIIKDNSVGPAISSRPKAPPRKKIQRDHSIPYYEPGFGTIIGK